MRKEITMLCIFSLGILADFLWFQTTRDFGFVFLLQTGLALLLLGLIVLVGRRYLAKRSFSRPKFSPASTLRFDRSKFRSEPARRRTALPGV